MDHASYYTRLEQGARYLASRAESDAEKYRHLGWANRYYRLRVEVKAQAEPLPLAAL